MHCCKRHIRDFTSCQYVNSDPDSVSVPNSDDIVSHTNSFIDDAVTPSNSTPQPYPIAYSVSGTTNGGFIGSRSPANSCDEFITILFCAVPSPSHSTTLPDRYFKQN